MAEVSLPVLVDGETRAETRSRWGSTSDPQVRSGKTSQELRGRSDASLKHPITVPNLRYGEDGAIVGSSRKGTFLDPAFGWSI